MISWCLWHAKFYEGGWCLYLGNQVEMDLYPDEEDIVDTITEDEIECC